MVEKFKEEILQKYSGCLSSETRGNLFLKTRMFNKNNHTNQWVETHVIGETYSWSWLAIREGGKHGKVIFVRNFRDKNLKNIFKDKINNLTKELENTFEIVKVLPQKKIFPIQYNLF